MIDPDDMCPNCVTPWKCNGPHVSPEEAATGDVPSWPVWTFDVAEEGK